MKFLLILTALIATLIITGCKDNPSGPEEVTQTSLKYRAQQLYSSGTDILMAADSLKKEYLIAPDSILSALYTAGYTAENITSAVRVVFQKLPVHAEILLKSVLKDPDLSRIYEMILEEYTVYLATRVHERNYYTCLLKDLNKSVRILQSTFNLNAETILTVLLQCGRSPVEIVIPIRTFFQLTDQDIIEIMLSLKMSAVEITKVLKICLSYNDSRSSEILINYFSVKETAGALKDVFEISSVRAAQLFAFSYQDLKEFLNLLLELGYSLRDAGLVMKDYYNLSAPDAAGIMKEMNFSAEQIASILKEVYNLNEYQILLILSELGFPLEDLVFMLVNIFRLQVFEIVKLLVSIGYSYCDILAIFNIPC